MADELETPNPESEAPELLPVESFPGAIDEELDEAEDSLDADELVVTTEPAPTPLGRSWAFDFAAKRFAMAGHQPIETRRTQTLLYWIEKCLKAPQGGSVIHPPDYGFDKPTEIFGHQFDAADSATLQERVEDALLNHPSITAIEAFQAAPDPEDDEALQMRFNVVLDDDTVVPVEEGVTLVA